MGEKNNFNIFSFIRNIFAKTSNGYFKIHFKSDVASDPIKHLENDFINFDFIAILRYQDKSYRICQFCLQFWYMKIGNISNGTIRSCYICIPEYFILKHFTKLS